MLRTFCSSIYRVTIPKDYQVHSLKRLSAVAEDNLKRDNDNRKFILKNEQKILKIVNENDIKNLMKYDIEVTDADEIISYRHEHGPYKSLNDILSIHKSKTDILHKFFISAAKRESKIRKYVTMPRINMLKLPERTLAIHVGTTAICWALVNKDFAVLEWKYVTWYNPTEPLKLYDIMQLVQLIVNELPESTVYVTEEVSFINSKVMQRINIIPLQILAAIMTCLDYRNKADASSAENNTYVLGSRTIVNMFNLPVGNESRSTNYAMKSVEDNIIKINDTEELRVDINDEIKCMYKTTEAGNQQQMCLALLKALAFLCMIKNNNTPNKV